MSVDTAPVEVVERIKKLLNLAANNENEHEAAAAMAKAQAEMERYNLSEAAIERDAGGKGKRVDELVEGGFYRYQQELWEAVADLNFCMYWSQKFLRRETGYKDRFGRHSRTGRRHRLVGRTVNVQLTVAMAQYLERAIERLSKERFPDQRIDNYVMSYRQGMAYRLVQRLESRRMDLLRAEREEATRAEEEARRKGVSTSTVLTLSSVTKTEHDANTDFLYGDGTSAQWAKERAERAAEREREEAAYAVWAANNPEAARAEEEKRKAEAKKGRSRGGSRDRRYDNVDHSAFWAGADKAKDVGLEPQMGSSQDKRIGR